MLFWTERSRFYNCRMFTDGFQKGHPYGELPPCIHVGILSFNQMISPNYYHKISLMDEKAIFECVFCKFAALCKKRFQKCGVANFNDKNLSFQVLSVSYMKVYRPNL